MKENEGNSPDFTTLNPCDHQAFFEALDSPASPTEALRAAFRRRTDCHADLQDIMHAND